MKLENKNIGITLISLVITIIILLILAGVSISALTDIELFTRAKEAKEQAKISEYEEQIVLSKTEAVMENYYPNSTQENILNKIKNNLSQKELFNDSDLEIEENTLIITTIDKFVFEVTVDDAGYIEIKYIAKADKIAPIINITSTINTTNSITVKVITRKNEGGSIEFYIAKSGENYDKKETIDNVENNKEYTYKFEGLEQGETYNVKAVAIATNKVTTETEKTSIITGIKSGDIIFTLNPSGWTNENVTVTAEVSSSVDITGFTLQTSKDGINYTSTATQIFDANGTIYARVVDNTNQYRGIATRNIENIDVNNPSAPSITVTNGTLGNNGYYRSNVTIKITQGNDNGSGVNRTTYILSGATSKGETVIANEETINITNDGTTNITAYTYDNANNRSQAVTYQIKKDVTAPIISLSQSNPTVLEDTKTVYFDYSDYSGLEVWKWSYGARDAAYIAANGLYMNNRQFTINMNDFYNTTGSKDLNNVVCSVYAKDNAGNESVKYITIQNLKANVVFTVENGLRYTDGAYINNGEICLPSTDKWQFGPYIILPAGNYTVLWDGYYINNIWTDVYASNGFNVSFNPCVTNGYEQPYINFDWGGGTSAVEFRCAPLGQALPVRVTRVTLRQNY